MNLNSLDSIEALEALLKIRRSNTSSAPATTANANTMINNASNNSGGSQVSSCATPTGTNSIASTSVDRICTSTTAPSVKNGGNLGAVGTGGPVAAANQMAAALKGNVAASVVMNFSHPNNASQSFLQQANNHHNSSNNNSYNNSHILSSVAPGIAHTGIPVNLSLGLTQPNLQALAASGFFSSGGNTNHNNVNNNTLFLSAPSAVATNNNMLINHHHSNTAGNSTTPLLPAHQFTSSSIGNDGFVDAESSGCHPPHHGGNRLGIVLNNNHQYHPGHHSTTQQHNYNSTTTPSSSGLSPTSSTTERTTSAATTMSFAPIAPIHNKQEESKKEIIRKEEIEAALKSKPQRGRKRENLSGLERQELTRTRNREHAKTTRIRKKARYEELVICETKYNDLLQKLELQSKRKNAVLQFMNVRSDLLINTQEEILLLANKRKSNHNDEASSSCWNFSFQEEDGTSSTSSNSGELLLEGAYKNIVKDCTSFTIDIISSNNNNNNNDNNRSGQEEEEVTAAKLSMIQNYDNRIVTKIRSKIDNHYSNNDKILFRFEIKDGKDGIALNEKDTGFAECEFVIVLLKGTTGSNTNKQEEEEQSRRLTLKSDFVKFMFDKDSEKIISMKIINHFDSSSSFNLRIFQNDDNELRNKKFPSVVSEEYLN